MIAWFSLILTPAQAQEVGTRTDVGGPRLAGADLRDEGALVIWAQLQTWITLMDQDVDAQADPTTYGDPEADPGFGMQRARLGLDGLVATGGSSAHQLDYALSLGVTSPFDRRIPADDGVQIVDARGRWTVDTPLGPYALAVGLQRVPWNRGTLMSSADLVFQERTIGSAWLAPIREVGAVGAQAFELGDAGGPQILLRGGVFNGNGDVFQDDDPGLLGAGRLELAVGEAYRTWSPSLDHALGVGLGVLGNTELATTTTGLAADLLARVRIVTLTAEILRSSIRPTDTTVRPAGVQDATAQVAWAGGLSVWIPIEDAHGLEVAGRLQRHDDATHLDNAGDVQIVHAGLTWRSPLSVLDLGGGWIHRTELQTAEIPNDTVRLWVQLRPEARVL